MVNYAESNKPTKLSRRAFLAVLGATASIPTSDNATPECTTSSPSGDAVTEAAFRQAIVEAAQKHVGFMQKDYRTKTEHKLPEGILPPWMQQKNMNWCAAYADYALRTACDKFGLPKLPPHDGSSALKDNLSPYKLVEHGKRNGTFVEYKKGDIAKPGDTLIIKYHRDFGTYPNAKGFWDERTHAATVTGYGENREYNDTKKLPSYKTVNANHSLTYRVREGLSPHITPPEYSRTEILGYISAELELEKRQQLLRSETKVVCAAPSHAERLRNGQSSTHDISFK